MSKLRVSTDDLAFAAEWLDNYEAQDDDENGDAARRVAAWLRAEVQRRNDEAVVREVVRRTGTTPTQARAALGRTREKTSGGDRS